jgi:AsmA protein
VNSRTKPQVFDKVNVEVSDFSYTSQFPFKVTAGLPGGGNANVSGKAGPISQQDAAMTPLEAAVKLNNMNLATSGFIDPASGIGGLANFEGTVNSSGGQAKSVGQVTCEKVKLSPKGSPASKPINVKYAANLDLAKQTGTISQGDVAIGKAIAHLTGGLRTQGETQVVDLRLNAPNMPVDELEAMLPAAGVVLPSGSKLQGGTLSAELGISGPVDKLVITGPVRLSNTQLAGFDLGAKLGALSAFAGKARSSRDTSIQNASLNARVAPEGTRADSINVTIPALGVVTGAGTVSPAGALDFKMTADLEGGLAGGLTQRAGLGGGKSGGVPFSITGTTSDPKFVPNMAGVAGSVAEGALGNALAGGKGATKGATGVTGAVGGLLGRKKPN